MKQTIEDVEPYEDGWKWTIVSTDDDWTGRSRYRTNNEGEGLFRWSDIDCCWKQGQGTLQFNLHKVRADRAAEDIMKAWNRRRQGSSVPYRKGK